MSRLILPGRAVSPWLDGAPASARPALDRDLEVDVAVIGAGIIGLTTALALHRAGASVAVLEGRQVAAAVTGNTTAKLSSLHGLAYQQIVSEHGAEVGAAYAAANESGIEWVRNTVSELGIECDLREKPNFTYTEDPERRGEIEAEVEAATAAGLPVAYTETTDLPFEVAAAVGLERQAEFHPVRYCRGLADELDRDQQRVYEGTRATGVAGGRVSTAAGHAVGAGHVVVATQLPFLDRSLLFARAPAERSYALTARIEGAVPQGMYISAEKPTRSLRAVPWDDGELLLVAGAGHELGQGDAVESVRDLEAFAERQFEVASFEHRWDAHDFMPEDNLPYIGRVTPLSDRILTASGMKKWGLAMGTAAGAILADRALGQDNEWAQTFDPWRLPPVSAAPSLIKHNAEAGVHLLGDRLKRGSGIEDLEPGEGRVVGNGRKQTAVHRDADGVLHAVSARCTHLGCIVNWNAAASTWDCPCHGSRFSPLGEVLNGPATGNLEREDPPDE